MAYVNDPQYHAERHWALASPGRIQSGSGDRMLATLGAGDDSGTPLITWPPENRLNADFVLSGLIQLDGSDLCLEKVGGHGAGYVLDLCDTQSAAQRFDYKP